MTDSIGNVSSNRKTARAILLAIVKWALFLAVLFFVGRALGRQFQHLSWESLQFSPLFLAGAIAALALSRLVAVISYRALIKPLCRPPGWSAMMSVTWVPQIGKYLPGKVASVAGAVWLLSRFNVRGSVALSVVFMRNGLSVILGLALASPLLLWQPVYEKIPMAWVWCALLLMVGIVCLHPKVFSSIGNFLLRRFGRQPLPTSLRLRDYAVPLIVCLADRLLIGVTLWFVARSVTDISVIWMPFFISAAALAMTSGFLAVFAPAGIGVQEGIFMLILTPLLGEGSVAIVIVAMRLTQIVVEVAFAGIGTIMLRLMRDKGDGE